jgi:hypothetical protein
MKKPNFFIIGTPKSGTTALSEYLRSHPNVFFSQKKELGYWKQPERCRTSSQLNAYLYHFRKAKSHHLAVGEGTPFYFRSTSAIRRIFAFNSSSKFILMIRNPIERFFSWHSDQFRRCHENIQDPETAWRVRVKNQNTDTKFQLLKYHDSLMYDKFCKVAHSVKALLNFPMINSKNIHIILFDDFIADPKAEYHKVLEFLSLPYDGRASFPIVNANQKIERPCLNKLILNVRCFFHSNMRFLMNLAGMKHVRHICRSVWLRLCFKEGTRKKPNKVFLEELKVHFRKEVEELSTILNRDLSDWVT